MVIEEASFGRVTFKDGAWGIQLTGYILKGLGRWSPAQVQSFWRKLVDLMKSSGVSNTYPKVARYNQLVVHWKKDPSKRLTKNSNVKMKVDWFIRKTKGTWTEEGALEFQKRLAELLSEEDLVFEKQEYLWAVLLTSSSGSPASKIL